MGVITREAGREVSRREGGKLLGGQCRTALRPDRHCTRMRLQLPSSISRSSVSPRVSKNTSSTRSTSSARRSEEHTSELQSLMRISYAVFCLKKKTKYRPNTTNNKQTKPMQSRQ